MDGGMLPWRNQKLMKSGVDSDFYAQSLPPPPVGFMWERNCDGSWELLNIEEIKRKKSYGQDNDNTKTDLQKITQPTVIEHTVLSTDTLQGLCLKYGTTAITLRRQNCFSGNNIQVFKTLRIPLEAGAFVVLQTTTDSKDIILQKFKNDTGEIELEAKLYLEDSGWNLDKAIAQWQGDDQWTKSNPKSAINVSNDIEDVPDVSSVRQIKKNKKNSVVVPLAIRQTPPILLSSK